MYCTTLYKSSKITCITVLIHCSAQYRKLLYRDLHWKVTDFVTLGMQRLCHRFRHLICMLGWYRLRDPLHVLYSVYCTLYSTSYQLWSELLLTKKQTGTNKETKYVFIIMRKIWLASLLLLLPYFILFWWPLQSVKGNESENWLNFQISRTRPLHLPVQPV